MLGFICFMFLMSFIFLWNAYLNLLLVLEGLMLSLMILLIFFIGKMEINSEFMMIYFFLMVMGGVLGLCLLINFSKESGEDLFLSNFFF